MKGAALIIAVNTDPQAPIFAVAHYGYAGDVLEFLPALTAAVKARKA
jgi:electron transfer flavoprotein alpha subunit